MTASPRFLRLGICLLAAAPLTGCSSGPPPPSALGMAALEKQEYDQAVYHFNAAIQADPDNPELWTKRGLAYLSRGDYQKAIGNFTEAIRLDPGKANLYLSRSIAWRLEREFPKAIADAGTAIELAPDDPRGYSTRAVAHHENGEHGKAVADYTAAIQRGGQGADLYLNRGIAHHDAGDFDRAIADFSEVLKQQPRNSAAFNNRARCHLKKRHFAEAKEDYESAIRFDRKSPFPYAGLAWIMATAPDERLRDDKKAITFAQKACELTDWKQPYCLNALAAAYAEAKRFDQAVIWQAKALELKDDFPEPERQQAKVRLEMFKAGQPYREQ